VSLNIQELALLVPRHNYFTIQWVLQYRLNHCYLLLPFIAAATLWFCS